MDPVSAEDFHSEEPLGAEKLLHSPVLAEKAHWVGRDGEVAVRGRRGGQPAIVLHGKGVVDGFLDERAAAGQQHVVISADLHGPEEDVVPEDRCLRRDPVVIADREKIIVPVGQRQFVDAVPAADTEGGVDVQAPPVPLTGGGIGILNRHSLAPVLESKRIVLWKTRGTTEPLCSFPAYSTATLVFSSS